MDYTTAWSDENNSTTPVTLAPTFDWELYLQKSIPVTFIGKTSNLPLRIISLALGYSFNLVVIVVIACWRSLWSPRHLHWGSVCLTGLIIQLLYTFEMVGSLLGFRFVDPNWCKVYSAFCSVPFTLLLSSILLAAWDRYQAITKPLWHRRNMTNYRAMLQIILSQTFVVAIVSSPFAFQLVPLQCGHNVFYTELMCSLYLVLIHVCLFLHVRVFWIAHKALRKASISLPQRSWNKHCPVHVRFKTTAAFLRWYNAVSREGLQKTPVTSLCICYERSSDLHTCNPLMRMRTASRLDLRAAFTVTLGMAPLWIFTLPFVVCVLLAAKCLRANVQCIHVQQALPILREVYVLYGVYNPVVYIWRSKEFQYAAKGLLRRWITRWKS